VDGVKPDAPERGNMKSNLEQVRKQITERLINDWDFTEVQLSDLSLFHLVNTLMLVAGHRGYLGQFEPTVWSLRQLLGEDQLFDKPSELRAKQQRSVDLVAADVSKVVVN
jgi:hypothetical protein